MMVTAVIPLYNKGMHIARALGSALAQTVGGLEVIVVDDGSTDGGHLVVERCGDPRVRLIRQENRGVSLARNRGIAEASGDIIAFLDADDAWKPDFVKTILRLRDDWPQAGAYATSYTVVRQDGSLYHPRFSRRALKPGYEGILDNYWAASCRDLPVWTSAVAVRRDVFDRAGLFPPGVPSGEDMDMWARIAIHSRFAYACREMAWYYQNAENRATTNKAVDRVVRPVIRTVEDAMADGRIPRAMWADAREFLNVTRINRANRFVEAAQYREARALLREVRTGRLLDRKLRTYLHTFREHPLYRLVKCIKGRFM